MERKSISSLQANMRKSMEILYDSCRRGRIHEIEKLHKRYTKAKEEYNTRLVESNKENSK